MIKKLFNNKWLQYFIPFSFTLFMLVTEKRIIEVVDGGPDRLYGFPFPYITNNFACTGCYNVYVGALLFDLLVYFIFTLLVFKGIEKLGIKIKTHLVPTVIGLMVSLMWIWVFIMTTQDSTFEIKNDLDYKVTHAEFVFDQLP